MVNDATNFLSGSVAGVISASAVYPFETIRTRMALDGKMRNLKMTAMLFRIVEVEGVRGLYKGLAPACVGLVVYKGIGFMTYERILIALELLIHNRNVLNFLAGGLAGVFAQAGIPKFS